MTTCGAKSGHQRRYTLRRSRIETPAFVVGTVAVAPPSSSVESIAGVLDTRTRRHEAFGRVFAVTDVDRALVNGVDSAFSRCTKRLGYAVDVDRPPGAETWEARDATRPFSTEGGGDARALRRGGRGFTWARRSVSRGQRPSDGRKRDLPTVGVSRRWPQPYRYLFRELRRRRRRCWSYLLRARGLDKVDVKAERSLHGGVRGSTPCLNRRRRVGRRGCLPVVRQRWERTVVRLG